MKGRLMHRKGRPLLWALAVWPILSQLPSLAAETPSSGAGKTAADTSGDSATGSVDGAGSVRKAGSAGRAGVGNQTDLAPKTDAGPAFEIVAEGQNRDGLVYDPAVYATPDRGFAVLLPRAVPKGAFLFALDHRAHEPVTEEPARDLLGFDAGGLKIFLGLRYGLLDGLDLGVERLNGNPELYDVYGFDARWTVSRESRHFLDLCVTGGLTWFEQMDAKDAVGYSGRVQAGRTLFRAVYLSAGVLAHSNSSHGRKASTDPDYSVSVPAYAGWVVLPDLTLAAEAVLPVAGYSAGWASWTVGPKFMTHGHTFALLLSTTQYTTTDGLASGSDRTGRPVFGFSITRRFGGE